MHTDDRFLFRLCLALGYRSIRELKDTMSHRELLQWIDYYSSEPFIADRIEVQLAQISDILMKTAGNTETSALDFMVSVSKEDKDKYKAEEKHKKVLEQLKNF